MRYQYRCKQCRVTSPPMAHSALAEARRDHRNRRHDGYTPDGEQIIEVPAWRPSDLPREQWAIVALFAIAFAIATWARFG